MMNEPAQMYHAPRAENRAMVSEPMSAATAPIRTIRRTPTFTKSRPAITEAIGQPSVIPESARPATSADRPRTPCTKVGMKVISPIIATPITSTAMLPSRMNRLGNIAVLVMGVAMIGLITFIPTFVQGVLGRSALVAGLALSGMTLGWPIASVIAGRLFVKVGVRRIVRIGAVAALIGSLTIALFSARGAWYIWAGSFIMGAGFGFLNTTY